MKFIILAGASKFSEIISSDANGGRLYTRAFSDLTKFDFTLRCKSSGKLNAPPASVRNFINKFTLKIEKLPLDCFYGLGWKNSLSDGIFIRLSRSIDSASAFVYLLLAPYHKGRHIKINTFLAISSRFDDKSLQLGNGKLGHKLQFWWKRDVDDSFWWKFRVHNYANIIMLWNLDAHNINIIQVFLSFHHPKASL